MQLRRYTDMHSHSLVIVAVMDEMSRKRMEMLYDNVEDTGLKGKKRRDEASRQRMP